MLKNLLKIHEIIIAYSKIPLMMNEFNSVTKQIFSEYSSIVHFLFLSYSRSYIYWNLFQFCLIFIYSKSSTNYNNCNEHQINSKASIQFICFKQYLKKRTSGKFMERLFSFLCQTTCFPFILFYSFLTLHSNTIVKYKPSIIIKESGFVQTIN